jgi:hypothetical protein
MLKGSLRAAGCKEGGEKGSCDGAGDREHAADRDRRRCGWVTTVERPAPSRSSFRVSASISQGQPRMARHSRSAMATRVTARSVGSYLAFLGRLTPDKGPEAAIRLARAPKFPLRIAAKLPRAERGYFKEQAGPSCVPPAPHLKRECLCGQNSAWILGIRASFQRDNLRRRF